MCDDTPPSPFAAVAGGGRSWTPTPGAAFAESGPTCSGYDGNNGYVRSVVGGGGEREPLGEGRVERKGEREKREQRVERERERGLYVRVE